MSPEHWNAGNVCKLSDITEEGRLILIDLVGFYDEEGKTERSLTDEAYIAVDQLLEALGAEGHEFT